MFKAAVAFANGQAYEDLFSRIMGHSRPHFVQVKPQGDIGDRKNDGYDKTTGHYFQVFAPEDPASSEAKAVAKLKSDFKGLREYWHRIHPIKGFSFAFNDKYHGTFPTIEADLAAIKAEHDLVECGVFLSKHLEDTFFSLPDDVVFSIIGKPPDPKNISNVDFGILKEVIDHIFVMKTALGPDALLVAPNFSEKIAFNGLGHNVGTLLTYGNFQSGVIDEYFSLNSSFAKNQLRDKLNSLYLVAKDKVSGVPDSDSASASDIVFFQLLDAIAPGGDKA